MKRERKGFTVVELLIVLAIIALLVGILLPALTAVKEAAKNAKQKAQFATIDMGLQAFRNDQGDYPPSDGWDYAGGGALPYCGAQKLAEALVGWDMLGFHPKSDWNWDGRTDAGLYVYDANDPLLLDQRKGPYLDLESANVFRLGDISARYPGLYRNTGSLAPDTFVLCDVFTDRTVRMPNGETVKAGAPILYYKADVSGRQLTQIYDARDNDSLVLLKENVDNRVQPLADPASNYQYFYEYIRDPKVTARPRPYRSDSYILISAGPDGLYGTSDDVTNFGN